MFVPFSRFTSRFEQSVMFLFTCAWPPRSSLKLLKAHSVYFKMPHLWENMPSLLPPWTKWVLQMWGFSTALILFFFFFTPFTSRPNPDEFPHLVPTGSKISGSAAESPGCTVCSEYAQIWLISLFGLLLRCGPASHSVGGRFENQGTGMTQQQGVQPEFLLAPLSWEPSGRRRGGEERCEDPDMPRHMKGLVDHSLWGDWMQRRRPLAGQNKDGLDCERDPQGGARWAGSYT